MIDPTVHLTLHKIEAEQRQRAVRDLYEKTQGSQVPGARTPRVHVSLAWVSLAGQALSASLSMLRRSVPGLSTYATPGPYIRTE